MTGGLTVYSERGVLQIDEAFTCFALVKKGHIDFSGNQGAEARGTFSFTATDIPIPAIRVNGNYLIAGIENYTSSNGVYTANFVIRGQGVFNGSLDYFIFDRPIPEPTNVGLEVFNAAGQLVFSSATPLLNICADDGDRLPATGSYAFWAAANLVGYLDVQDSGDPDSGGNPQYTFTYNQYRDGARAVPGEIFTGTNVNVLSISGAGTGGYQDGILNDHPLTGPPFAIDVTNL